MAKDVRKFVQSFNMSRQFVEQQQDLQEEETLDQEQIQNQPNKKRTDWSEYIEPDINDVGIDDDEGELCELNIVTELPKPLFKKPKLRCNYSAAGFDFEDDVKLRIPAFGKRNVNKKIYNPDKERRTTVKESSKSYNDKEIGASSNRREYHEPEYHDNVDHGFAHTGLNSVMMKLKRPVSKWNDFIDDADDLQLESRCQEINHDAFEMKVSDEIVEDDVHPDFL